MKKKLRHFKTKTRECVARIPKLQEILKEEVDQTEMKGHNSNSQKNIKTTGKITT